MHWSFYVTYWLGWTSSLIVGLYFGYKRGFKRGVRRGIWLVQTAIAKAVAEHINGTPMVVPGEVVKKVDDDGKEIE